MDAATHRPENTVSGIRPSPDAIMQLGYAFRGSRVVFSAVELDLFTMLATAPCDAETLRQHLGLHARGARDFFDALVALGMLERRNEIYFNTAQTDFYLDRNKPTYIGGILHLASKRLYGEWMSLTTVLRTGQPREFRTDEDMFDVLSADPAGLAEFARAMTGLSLPVAQALSNRVPWRRYSTFIDVGTSEGAAPVEIAHANSHLSGGGLDLPQMQPLFDAYVQRHGLTDRLKFCSRDFLKEKLPSADVLIMGQILHDWNLPVKRDLLAKAYAALPKHGALIVYDQMIDNERRGNASGLLMSLSMLIRTQGGFDYTASDCISWMRDTGFVTARHEHLTGPYSMVVGSK